METAPMSFIWTAMPIQGQGILSPYPAPAQQRLLSGTR
jgi:hypothetical protein